ncbi:EF-hand domain-containing protein [Hydrogenophaga sp.]|uniref:EF-hand domain-containing protein n=1 Tax=Hydrogenophaga sp. TaxID=1904254 RepID=UPI0035682C13
MKRFSQRISDFETSSLLLVAAWTLGVASTAFAQNAPAPAPESDKALTAAFMEADKNADGKIDREEAEQVPTLVAKFQRIDGNGDGSISFEEYTKAMKM